MPFIQAKTNISLSRKQKENVKRELGEAITIMPGKSEEHLMIAFEDSISMYFRGDSIEPCAMLEVDLYQGTTKEGYDKFTKKATEIISKELSIDPNQIFVAYKDLQHWGLNGKNF